jgi:hypothetical protein
MVTQQTAGLIWECYREIAAAEKLLADMEAEAEDYFRRDDFEPRLQDAFGRRRELQLGVPSGDMGHRLYNVSATLAQSVIRAHIANKQADLVKANEQARIELSSSRPLTQGSK